MLKITSQNFYGSVPVVDTISNNNIEQEKVLYQKTIYILMYIVLTGLGTSALANSILAFASLCVWTILMSLLASLPRIRITGLSNLSLLRRNSRAAFAWSEMSKTTAVAPRWIARLACNKGNECLVYIKSKWNLELEFEFSSLFLP